MKYLPYVLIVIAFISGLLLSGGNDAEEQLLENMKAERRLLMEKVVEKQVEITRLQADSAAVNEKRLRDSIYFAGKLSENQRAYLALKKKYYEINLRRANSSTLDSIILRLYSE